MSVKIITGAIGSGKTEYCIDDIKQARAAAKRRCIMLVPSHFSHETEKLIINSFGGTGLNGIDVTTFEKLARELLTGTERRLAAPGKQALICRAIQNTLAVLDKRRADFDSRLIGAVSKNGFIDVASSLISELHRYMISSTDLKEQAKVMEPGALKQKLDITALIVENYDAMLNSADYIDSDEDLLRLAEKAGGKFGGNTSVWIDRFDEFLPQQLEVVYSIIDSGADVTLCFNVCEEEFDTYYGTKAAITAIKDHCDVQHIHLKENMKHIRNAPDLKHLFATWHDRRKYDGEVKNADIFEARDAYTEVERLACRILDFVREDNYRFRDIAVICGNQDSYAHVIKAVFSEYDIPYYTDEHFSIAEHPISMQLLSLFDIIENNWDYSSMFEYLRAGFIYRKIVTDGKTKYRRLDTDDIDLLENHVLKYGIRGKSMWSRSWTDRRKTILEEALDNDEQRDNADNERLDELRSFIIQPLIAYSERSRAAHTVTGHCRALYSFLEDINLYQGLKAELLGMAMNRATADAQRFGQIWNMLLDLLDQVNTALGDYEVTPSQFCEYMRAAMGQCSLRTIPSGVDRVFIGSVEKNRSENSKVMFIIGAVSGTFPTDSQIEGFLSNADREALAALNLRLAPTTMRKNEKQYNNVYKTLCTATEKLCISYPVQTPDGKACRPSQTVIDITDKLPNIKKYDDIIIKPEQEIGMYISSPAATLHKLLIRPGTNALWPHVHKWFDLHGEWRHRLFKINDSAESFGKRIIELNPGLAASLYPGQIFYSPTHLNTYAQCPFRNFMQYGLSAREREIHQMNAADAGSYAHELVRRFCEEIDRGYDWKTIDDSTCENIVDDIIARTLENISDSQLADKERAADIFRRMGKTVKEVAKTVRKSVCSGDFRPYAYEQQVKEPLTDSIGIRGTIDRLDRCSHDGINEYRIIDYKTGGTSFSPAEICSGLNMQPVIYALVLQEMDKNRQLDGREADNTMISGLYYSKMRYDYAKLKPASRAGTLEKELKKNTMLDGATFVSTNPDGTIIPESADRIESELARAEDPLFFAKGAEKIGGSVHSREAAGRLMDAVRDKIIETDTEIRQGKIGISPLDNACAYCAYAPACKFDENCMEPRSIDAKDAEVWDVLEGNEVE